MSPEPHRYVDDPGERFDVRPGDVWKVGDHVVCCGDLEKGDHRKLLELLGANPHVTYCDPPWTPQMATGFRTKAGDPRRVEFEDLLRLVADACRYARREVFCEMGRQHHRAMERALRTTGLSVDLSVPIVYARKHPAFVLRGYHRPLNDADVVRQALYGMDDAHIPAWVLQHRVASGEVVWDPCLGRGLTLVSADDVGRTCWGMELSPRRAATAIAKVAVRYGGAQRIRSLY